MNDKAEFSECRELLGIPARVLGRRENNGRLALDTDQPGQQAFQAILWDCFFSRDLEHPWDRHGGRSFRDLILHFSYIAPQSHRLLIATNTAGRVASYLLPYTRTFPDGSYEHYGIPGLRVEQVRKRTLVLRHLPTGGLLALQDNSFSMTARTMRYLLNDEVEVRRGDETDTRRPVWRQKGLTTEEEVPKTTGLRHRAQHFAAR
ncbi:hypothetical protein [Streptomyces decoyicus]|uniref:hypothetical protein n=1 Tax=Streptomyces decoyicus TaxID=249567 RepID=UPI00382A3B3B